MSGHTPGRWQYIASNKDCGPYVTSDYGDICDCFHMPVANQGGPAPTPIHFTDHADANARLIAAAPELLVALKVANCRSGFDDDVQELINEALLKAEGQQ